MIHLFVIIAVALLANSSSGERVGESLFETSFNRSECLSTAEFVDISDGGYLPSLEGDKSSVTCLNSNGISTNLTVSEIIPVTSSIKIETEPLQTISSMTFDMWLQFPNQTIDRDKLIMSVGKDQLSSRSGAGDFAFELYQRPLEAANAVSLSLAVGSGVSINTLTFSNGAPVHEIEDENQVIHIALVIYYYEIFDPRLESTLHNIGCDLLINGVYIDYVSTRSDTSTFAPSVWPSNYYQLNFFNTYNQGDRAVWEGSLRHFAWYPRVSKQLLLCFIILH